jgi:hypothetical protein
MRPGQPASRRFGIGEETYVSRRANERRDAGAGERIRSANQDLDRLSRSFHADETKADQREALTAAT